MQHLGITAQDFIPTHKNQGRRELFQVSQQRRHQRIFRRIRIALGIEPQLLPGQGNIAFLIGFKALPREGQIRPGGNGNDAAGQGQPLLPQIQA